MTDLVLRPSVRNSAIRSRVVGVAVFIAIMLVLPTIIGGLPGLIFGVAFSTVIIAPIAALLLRSRVVVTPTAITVRGMLLQRRKDRATAASVVRAMLVVPRTGLVDTVFVLDAKKRPLLRINGNIYRTADLDRLVQHLGLPTAAVQHPVTVPQLESMHPGIVSWVEANPFRVGCVGAGIAVVVILVLASVITAVTL
ncbi:hypothetical protein [Jiangella asiatica]|uniref:Uncharacterized protein n=1 Tax=Jiangella asiatica TaxID=2530372 RepID=A0A4R5CQX7_9ACTN|nr:hypothetical protein [Jiangella asiatica]TDE00095.1 hypothetical protein E1269_26615 [Jiangella asiatica]